MSTTQQPQQKFCRDCKYISFWFVDPDWKLKKCHHPSLLLPDINLVTGQQEHLVVSCEDMRYTLVVPTPCGPEGKLWEPRNSLYETILATSFPAPVKKKSSVSLEDLL